MKANRLLIAATCFLAASLLNFCLAFVGDSNNFAARIVDGFVFLVCLFFAWREWNKQKQSNG